MTDLDSSLLKKSFVNSSVDNAPFISAKKSHVVAIDFEINSTSARRKRFLKFPQGTVVQLVYCYLMSALGSKDLFTVGVTIGTNWDVPTDLHSVPLYVKTRYSRHRRDRRSIYPKIENILNRIGIDGKACVRYLICEAYRAKSYFKSDKAVSFIEKLIITLFQYSHPIGEMWINPNEPLHEYDYSHQTGKCSIEQGCSFIENNLTD